MYGRNQARNRISYVTRIVTFSCYFMAFLLFGFVLCTQRLFGDIFFDQLLFFLFNTKSAAQADKEIILLYIVYCLLVPLILSLITTYFDILASLLSRIYVVCRAVFFHLNLKMFFRFLPFIVFLISVLVFCHTFKLSFFIKSQVALKREDSFNKYYKPLENVMLSTRKNPQNVLLIYVESLESTYQRVDVFGQNLLQAMLPWEAQGVSFRQYHQVAYTGSTLPGIIATQCGVPLRVTTKVTNYHLTDNMVSFLPNAVCLSDVLSRAGYYNVFMKGASLQFSGLDKFLQSHHYDEMYGKEEWLAHGYTAHDMHGWGLYDEHLFKEAKKTLMRLVAKKQPFNLTILTVDLHGPYGFMGPVCQQVSLDSFRSLLLCQASMLSMFLQDIKKAGLLENTNVIIMGDHLAMRNPLSPQLKKTQGRYIYNLILPVDPVVKLTDRVNHYSWLPTILTLLHFDVPDGAGGLGFTAITREKNAKHLLVKQELSEEILSGPQLMQSKHYQALWT